MPLLRKPSTEILEDHFFGSGAEQWEWFRYTPMRDSELNPHFPVRVDALNEDNSVERSDIITEDMFIEGIKMYASRLPDRTFDDLIEDMDASDVDSVVQLIIFGQIVYG